MQPRPFSRLVRLLAPRLWPADPALRWRVVAALAALVIAKLVAVTVPFWFKGAVDTLSAPAPAATLVVGLVVAYGLARVLATGFEELRDAVFARVAQRAGRGLAREVYEHLFRLSLRLRLDRRTGEPARAAVGRTALVLAPGLPTVVDVDGILVPERGRVTERGTHARLLARGGLRAEMWARRRRPPAGTEGLAARPATC